MQDLRQTMHNLDDTTDRLFLFIQDLRQTTNDVDATVFNTPINIPVAIIGWGCWVATDLQAWGDDVMQAQRDFVQNDAHAVNVPTDELS